MPNFIFEAKNCIFNDGKQLKNIDL